MGKNVQEADVIIIGGGPVGLALAGDLGWRGISVALLEQTDGVVHHPKMDGIDLRVMEFCRRWGLVDRMKEFPFPPDYPQDMVYVTSLCGYELGRESFATPSGGGEQKCPSRSPETRIRCPQTFFDPILRGFAESFPTVSLMHRCRYTEFQQDKTGMTVYYESGDPLEMRQLRGKYMVACDGANSAVRGQLGIAFQGPDVFNYTTNVLFKAKDLFSYHDKRPGYRWLFIGPQGTYGTMSAINGHNEWRAQLFSEEGRPMTDEEIRARLEKMTGRPFDYELISVSRWTRRELVADSYRKGRVFMAGDACHATSPTGGFGMNTGIKDAVDLAWKLEAVLKGWGGERLLDSYETERRPSGARAVREASGNWKRMLSPGKNPRLLEPSYEGALLRYHVGRRFSASMLREWYKLGIDLGYVYEGSPICWPDESPKPLPARPVTVENANADILRERQRLQVHCAEGNMVEMDWAERDASEVMLYEQSSQPGARAPHVWLEDGRSSLDLFGKGFVLLRLGTAAPKADVLIAAAKKVGLPLTIYTSSEEPLVSAYGRALVLVRPDGHVAWRGDDWPRVGVDALIQKVRGA